MWDAVLQILHSIELHNAWAMGFPVALVKGSKQIKPVDLGAKPPRKQDVRHLLLRKADSQVLGVMNKETVMS